MAEIRGSISHVGGFTPGLLLFERFQMNLHFLLLRGTGSGIQHREGLLPFFFT